MQPRDSVQVHMPLSFPSGKMAKWFGTAVLQVRQKELELWRKDPQIQTFGDPYFSAFWQESDNPEHLRMTIYI